MDASTKTKYMKGNNQKKKYMKGKGLLKVSRSKQSSWLWKGIWKSKPLVSEGACYQIHSGLGTNIWDDSWVPSLPNFSHIRLGAIPNDINWVFQLKT